MTRKIKLLIWELGCIFWIVFAGSLLHFSFELSDYWRPMALIAAVNESIWEHLKMYFWPGLAFALVQYTYSREYANNYWLGKASALLLTPAIIIVSYDAYTGYAAAANIKPSLGIMLGIMFIGVFIGQMSSYFILSAPPMGSRVRRIAPFGWVLSVGMFSTFTFFPPKLPLFENFACYTYTGEYGILSNYSPYRIFARADENGRKQEGLGINYCDTIKAEAIARLTKNKD